MRNLLRFAASLVVILGCSAAIDHFAAAPLLASRTIVRVEHLTELLTTGERTPQASMALIHERIADARRIEASYPPLINSYVAEGTLLDMMNRPADADAAYRKGLQFDRRPEIYFNMAGTAMARGQREPAIELYLYAILFNPTMLDYIPYEDVKEIVRRRCRREGGPCP